jgi:phosphoserine phosphatase
VDLTLVRHGATLWNAQGRFQGITNLPLTAQGRAQARALSVRLAGERADCIYSSDLLRARETAEIIARPHRLKVLADTRLREFGFGRWEGLTWEEILALQPEARGRRDAGGYEPEGGERFEAVCRRIASFYADLARTATRHAIVVTHAGALHATLQVLHLSSGPSEKVNFHLASITRIAMEEEGSRLIALSDVEHLERE